MTTKITNSQDFLDAFNENFEGLLTKKRKLPVANAVNKSLAILNNYIGRQLLYRAQCGDTSKMNFFETISIKETTPKRLLSNGSYNGKKRLTSRKAKKSA